MRGMENLKAMLSPEKLLSSMGIDGDTITNMFTAQLEAVKAHFQEQFDKIAQAVQSAESKQLSQFIAEMDALDRIGDKLRDIEISLVKSDPTYVTSDFLKENGLPLDLGKDADPEDTRIVAIPISPIPVWQTGELKIPTIDPVTHETTGDHIILGDTP